MSCNFSPAFIVSTAVNCGAVLITVKAIVCIVLNNLIDPSIRGILLSFSISNIFGAIIIIYDSYAVSCFHDDHEGGKTNNSAFVVYISATLSLCHLMLLIMAEYIILTSSSKRTTTHFTGLIIVSWMISVSLGSVNAIMAHNDTRLVFAITFFMLVLIILGSFFVIVKRHRIKGNNIKTYHRKFLLANFPRDLYIQKKRRYWKLRFFVIIIASYIACSVLWVINEMCEGLGNVDLLPHGFHSLSLVIYSMNFYFFPVICIYAWYKRYKRNELRKNHYRQTYV